MSITKMIVRLLRQDPDGWCLRDHSAGHKGTGISLCLADKCCHVHASICGVGCPRLSWFQKQRILRAVKRVQRDRMVEVFEAYQLSRKVSKRKTVKKKR